MNIAKNKLGHCILMSLILSIGWVLYLYPISFLQGQGHYFELGDASQHVSGWLSYSSDKWHYPLLFTNLINYPEGVNIAFLDSIPLIAILLKAIKKILPENFHYFGLWHAFAYLSQGIASVMVIRAAGFKTYFSSFAAIVFALISPVLLFRLGHTALMTQSLILFSLANYFYFINNAQSFTKASNIQIVILLCSFLIHPYFFAFNCIFLMTFFCLAFQKNKNIFPILRKTILLTLLMGIIFLIFGYNGQNSKTLGYDIHSMNLGSIFSTYDATGGQYEGYSYLGRGIILLLLVNLIFHRKIIFKQIKKHQILIIFLMLLTLYAVSNKAYIGNYKIFEYDVPSFLTPITNTFRVSGRFFWPVFYFITFAIIMGILSLNNKKFSIILIVLALIVQFLDLKPLSARIRMHTRESSKLNISSWKEIVASVDGLIIFPFYEHGIINPHSLAKYQKIASHFSKFTNSSLVARLIIEYKKKLSFINEYNPEKALYIIQTIDLERNLFAQSSCSTLYDLVLHENCPIQDEFILCRKGATREWWINQLGPCEFYSPKIKSPNTIYFDAINLPTMVGIPENTFLISETGKSGYLSYGPYIFLPSGKYKAIIDFMSSNSSKEDVGIWDINVYKPEMNTQLIANNIFNSDNQSSIIETVFEISPEFNNSQVEIRTFFNGKGHLTLKSIMLEKL